MDNETGEVIVVPGFITPDGDVIFFDTPSNKDIGDYEVKVCSTIYNFLNTTECIDFDFKVEPVPDVKVWTVEPDFMVGLDNQRVKVGDSLLYTLEDT